MKFRDLVIFWPALFSSACKRWWYNWQKLNLKIPQSAMVLPVAGHQQITQFPENAGAYNRIHFCIAGTYFAQIKTNQFSAAAQELPQQVIGLFYFKSAGHRCTGIGTKLWVKPVYIKAKVYMLRQVGDDFVCYLFPGLAFKLAFFQFMVEIRKLRGNCYC